MNFRPACIFIALLIVLVQLSLNRMADAHIETVAWTGTDPGTVPGEFFNAFSLPSLNDAGQVSFGARLQNANGSLEFHNDSGIWNYNQGKLRSVSRLDLTIGAEPVFGPFRFTDVSLGNDNSTYFQASDNAFTEDGTSVTYIDPGLWSDRQGVLANVLDRTVPLAGTGGITSRYEFGHAVSASGQFVFGAQPTGFGAGVWQGSSSGTDLSDTDLVVAVGDIVPAINGEIRSFGLRPFATFGGDFRISDGGSVAVLGEAQGDEPRTRDAIWFDDGKFQLAAMQGQSIDGQTNGPVFSTRSFPTPTFSSVNVADDGVAFLGVAELGVGGVSRNNDEGVYRFSTGNLQTIAQEGNVAPGIDATFGDGFLSTFKSVASNRFGDIAFTGFAGGQGGVWTNRDGPLELVSQAILSFLGDGVAINNRKQIAFLDLASGLVAESPQGTLIPIAELGAPFEIEPGVTKTLVDINFGRSGLNERGQIAFVASFDDGSRGIFISHAVVVPEPTYATAWIALLTISAFFVRPSGQG